MLATFFSISASDVATTTGHVTSFLGDFEPVLLAVVGVGVALIVVYALIGILKK